jgi:hypothetical protein
VITRRKAKQVSEQGEWPWKLPQLSNAEIFALQALERGTANAHQQQLAIACIELKICAARRMSFYPGAEDGRRASDFAEGKRWVGDQIRRLLKLRPEHDGRAMSEPKDPPAPAESAPAAETKQE